MKQNTQFLLQKYREMSGDKKIQIALSLSKVVRQIRYAGSKATGDNQWKMTRENFSK